MTFDLNKQLTNEGSTEVRDLIKYLNDEVSVQNLKDMETGVYFGKSLFIGYQKLIKIFFKIQQDINDYKEKKKQGKNNFGNKMILFMEMNQIMNLTTVSSKEINNFF